MSKRFRFLLRLRARYNLFALMNIDTFDSSMPSTSAPQMLPTEASAPVVEDPACLPTITLWQQRPCYLTKTTVTFHLRYTQQALFDQRHHLKYPDPRELADGSRPKRSLWDSRNDQRHMHENPRSYAMTPTPTRLTAVPPAPLICGLPMLLF